MHAAIDPDRLQRGSRPSSARAASRSAAWTSIRTREICGLGSCSPTARGSRPRTGPHAVVWPEHRSRDRRDRQARARAGRPDVAPYGGGSGVCGGAVPLRGGITIDTKRMQQVRAVRDAELICDVEAGPVGRALRARDGPPRLTFGHFPSSIYCSTVGGWLATRARRPALDEVRQGRGPRRGPDARHGPRRGDRDRRAAPRAARPELDAARARQRGHARRDHVGAAAGLARAAAARVPRLRGPRRRDGRAGDPARCCSAACARRSCGCTTSSDTLLELAWLARRRRGRQRLRRAAGTVPPSRRARSPRGPSRPPPRRAA